MSIPAKKLVEIIPGVIGVGGAALALSGLLLTADTAAGGAARVRDVGRVAVLRR